jgi:hypothetical protein
MANNGLFSLFFIFKSDFNFYEIYAATRKDDKTQYDKILKDVFYSCLRKKQKPCKTRKNLYDYYVTVDFTSSENQQKIFDELTSLVQKLESYNMCTIIVKNKFSNTISISSKKSFRFAQNFLLNLVEDELSESESDSETLDNKENLTSSPVTPEIEEKSSSENEPPEDLQSKDPIVISTPVD